MNFIFKGMLMNIYLLVEYIVDYLLNIIVFVCGVYYLSIPKENIFFYILKAVPIDQKTKIYITDSINNSINGVFKSSIKICIYHFLLTWLFIDIGGMKFSFVSSLISSFMALIPIFSPWILMIPYTFYIYYIKQVNLIMSLGYILLYFMISN